MRRKERKGKNMRGSECGEMRVRGGRKEKGRKTEEGMGKDDKKREKL